MYIVYAFQAGSRFMDVVNSERGGGGGGSPPTYGLPGGNSRFIDLRNSN